MSDATTELMIQPLNRDLFYIRALLDGRYRRHRLNFYGIERVYTEEVLKRSHILLLWLRCFAV